MAQDDYYYEIQLTNKQLVFYFMTGATGLILSFLAGVMVGRGVDTAQGEVQARTVTEERVVSEEPAVKATPSPDLSYAQRLESDRVEASLERSKPAAAGAPAASATVTPTGGPAAAPPSKPAAPPVKPAAPPATLAAAAPAPGAPAGASSQPTPVKPGAAPTPAPARPVSTSSAAKPEVEPARGEASFTIQVGAFKDKATADSVTARLKGKGFAAYVMAPESSDLGL